MYFSNHTLKYSGIFLFLLYRKELKITNDSRALIIFRKNLVVSIMIYSYELM